MQSWAIARRRQVPFWSARGLDVLPIEASVFYKRLQTDVPPDVRAYYDRLYAAELTPGVDIRSYEPVPFAHRGLDRVDLADAYGTSLWVALHARQADAVDVPGVRDAIKGRTLSVGVVPVAAGADAAGGLLALGGYLLLRWHRDAAYYERLFELLAAAW